MHARLPTRWFTPRAGSGITSAPASERTSTRSCRAPPWAGVSAQHIASSPAESFVPAPDPARSNFAMFAFLWRLLDARRRRQFAWLQLVSLLMACSTLGGVAAILPFFSVLADPGAIERHAVLGWLYRA